MVDYLFSSYDDVIKKQPRDLFCVKTKIMSQSLRKSISMCMVLSKRAMGFQKAMLTLQRQKSCSRDFGKKSRGESTIFILYKDLLVKIIQLSSLY